MAQTQDWVANGFTAFAGPAALNHKFMVKTRKNGVEDVDADILGFYTWIETLRANVGTDKGTDVGIPQAYVASVQALLAAFFPPMQANKTTWVPAIRIKSGAGGTVAVESLVDFGTRNPRNQLQIVDGPTALGYIFSVAVPPANPTWLNYYLPLAALYCRCLYLAFVKYRDYNQQQLVLAPGDLPQMSCVMYNGENQNVRYVYGSTRASIPASIGAAGARRANSGSTLDNFRRQNVLVPALGLANPGTQIPRYSPRTIEAHALKLWSKLYKTAAFDVTEAPLLAVVQELQKTIINAYEKLLQCPPGTLLALPFDLIFGHAVWNEKLLLNLRTVVRDRYRNAATYNRNQLSQDVVTAWKNIIATYLAPHIYVKTDTSFAKEVTTPDPATTKVVGDAIATELGRMWQQFSNAFLNHLDAVYNETLNVADHTPFGRCAETYCLVGMQPHYFQNETMDLVRGISLHIPSVGGSDSFEKGFGTAQLATASVKLPYRLPCTNCQELLPLYGCVMGPQGQQNYNTDIWAAPDKNNTELK
ncbi:hypothetical protein F5Y17DRAFT_442787 [Xylariaceae sp. FL0594]|nr:hypothetical protein F5Y17DRAFT_442787 [Xylariaceae sp. FL0594]